MNSSLIRSRLSALLLPLAAAAVVAVSTATPARAANGVPEVLSPQATAYGKTYAEWSAAWWQWFFALPVQGHPAIDPNADVAAGQSGNVWFLAAPFGTQERSITVPAGKALFIPLVNVDSSSLEEPPFFGATAQEQLAVATGFASYMTDLSFSVDGKSLSNLGDFYVTSAQFGFTAPSPWIFGATGGSGTATGVGYFVLLHPLSAGTHTIHYTGAFKFSEAPEDYIGVDATYHVTVK